MPAKHHKIKPKIPLRLIQFPVMSCWMTQQLDQHEWTKVPGLRLYLEKINPVVAEKMSMFHTHRKKSESLWWAKRSFPPPELQDGIKWIIKESSATVDIDSHSLSLHLLHFPVTTWCLFATLSALTSFYSALNFSCFSQISSGFPWWVRSVRCRWGPFPHRGRGGARTTARRAMMTSLKKLARPTMPASAATWAPSWCLSQTWRRWSSSASSRPPVLAAGASVWSWAHILSVAALKHDLYLSSIIHAHR